MKRFIGGVLAAGIVLTVASACVENKGTLFVQGVMAPPIAMAGTGCIFDPQATSTLQLYQGVLDIAFSNTYSPVFLMANEMVPRGSTAQLRVETSRVQLQGATVRLTDATGAQITAFTALSGGYVRESDGNTPGYGAFAVTVIDPDTVEGVLRPQLTTRYSSKRVIAYVKPYGQTLGGLHVEAGEYQWPIEVCNGCLVSFPVDAQDPLQPTPNCLNAGTGAASINSPCFFGQDQIIDCRLCPNNPACQP
jgi:hypothetical protein